MGLGVFLGIIPGAGPIISLILASALKLNKAAALLGCLATNTWISFISAAMAVKIGAYVFHLEWQKLWLDAKNLIQNLRISDLFNLTFSEILVPVLTGYLIIATCLALVAYLGSFLMITQYKKNHRKGAG